MVQYSGTMVYSVVVEWYDVMVQWYIVIQCSGTVVQCSGTVYIYIQWYGVMVYSDTAIIVMQSYRDTL